MCWDASVEVLAVSESGGDGRVEDDGDLDHGVGCAFDGCRRYGSTLYDESRMWKRKRRPPSQRSFIAYRRPPFLGHSPQPQPIGNIIHPCPSYPIQHFSQHYSTLPPADRKAYTPLTKSHPCRSCV